MLVVDPDRRDENPSSMTVSNVRDFIELHFRGVEHCHPAVLEFCMITKTVRYSVCLRGFASSLLQPDRDSILDKHPDHPNIVIGAGFSGHLTVM